MDLQKYLKSEIPGSDLLLDSSKAKIITSPFTIGKNELTFYGIPVFLHINSSLFRILPLEELAKNPRLATNIELTDENLPGLVFIWLYMNRILSKEPDPEDSYYFDLLEPYSVLDFLVMLEFGRLVRR